jgi:hypothetical protein
MLFIHQVFNQLIQSTNLGPHVFGCVHSNSSYSDLDELIEITGDFLTDVVQSPVQISQAVQVAISHVGRVVVVVDIAFRITKCCAY